MSHKKRATKVSASLTGRLRGRLKKWWDRNLWNKFLTVLVAVVVLSVSGMYGIAQWYIQKHANEPLVFGATFIPDYARGLDLDPEETMDAMINDLGIRHFRLVSYWENGEHEPGKYDFSFLDWQFEKAQAAGAKVSLAIGLRQPRWPECHIPDWAVKLTKDDWEPALKKYIAEVVKRYSDHPALESYQLENEFLLRVFGDCFDHDRQRVIEEFDMVKNLDPDTPIIVSRSDNAIPSWPVREPRADLIGASIYKRVWDRTITNRYFEYPLPAWYYAFLAGGAELTTGRNTFIHELQAESWLPDGFSMKTASTEEMYKSLNPERLRHRFSYAVATGMKRIDLWGVEWWYYMKEVRNEPELWNVAREKLTRYRNE